MAKQAQAVPAPKPEPQPPRYSFATNVPCPRCRVRTRRTGQYKATQYRVCTAPICRHEFSVQGNEV